MVFHRFLYFVLKKRRNAGCYPHTCLTMLISATTFFVSKSFLSLPATRNLSFTFPETRVPARETTYYCQLFDLPVDDDYHLVATEPILVNKDTVHHILLFGCDPSGGLTIVSEKASSEEYTGVEAAPVSSSHHCYTISRPVDYSCSFQCKRAVYV